VADTFVNPWPAVDLGPVIVPPEEPIAVETGEYSLLFSFSATIINRTPEVFILKSAVPQMLPRFIIEEHPRMASFMEKWCDFVERYYDPDGTKNPGPYFVLKNLLPLVDIDETFDEFIRYHKLQYGSDLPDISAADAIHVLKRVREFYQTKGSPRSFEYFFRFVFNSFLRIELPKQKMLRASGGVWNKPYLIRLRHIDTAAILTPVEQAALFDLEIKGETSGARAFLGYPVISGLPYWNPTNDREGFFTLGETVTLSNGERYYIGYILEPAGSWLNSDGFLSSDMRLQDSYYWQDFSYVLVSSEGLGATINPVLKNLHPAGLKLFARISPENAVEIPVWGANWDWDLRRLFKLHLLNWIPYTGVLDGGSEVPDATSEPTALSIVMSSRIQAFYGGSQFQRTKESVEWQHYETILMGGDNTIASIAEEVMQEKNSICFFGGIKLPVESDPKALTPYADVLVQSVDAGILSYDVGSVILSTIGDLPISAFKFISSYELPAYTESFSVDLVNRVGSSFTWTSGRPAKDESGYYEATLHFRDFIQDGAVSFAGSFVPGTVVGIETYPLIPNGTVVSASTGGIDDFTVVVYFTSPQDRYDFVAALYATFAEQMNSSVADSGRLRGYDTGAPRSSLSEGHLLFRSGRLVPRSQYVLGLVDSRTTITITNPVYAGERELYEFIESPKWTRAEFTVVAAKSVEVPGATSLASTLVFVNGLLMAGGSQSFLQDGRISFSNSVTGNVVVVYWDNLTTVISRVKTTLGINQFRAGDTNGSFLGIVPDRMVITP
jgi:hypothetical protein